MKVCGYCLAGVVGALALGGVAAWCALLFGPDVLEHF